MIFYPRIMQILRRIYKTSVVERRRQTDARHADKIKQLINSIPVVSARSLPLLCRCRRIEEGSIFYAFQSRSRRLSRLGKLHAVEGKKNRTS